MMKKEKTKEKITGTPSALSSFHMEADRSVKGMTLFISGIIGISDFTDECIMLMSHGGRITVEGRSLQLCIYENNTASISGKVEDIRFTYGKNR